MTTQSQTEPVIRALIEAYSLGEEHERTGGPRDPGEPHATFERLAIELVGATSSPWRPIAECGELEEGKYLCLVEHPDDGQGGGDDDYHEPELVDYGDGWLIDCGYRVTHIHQMGPIRGPGETK